MDWTGTIVVSIVMMLAVIASIVRDLRMYRRLGAGRGHAYRPVAASLPVSSPVVKPEQPALARAASLAGSVGDSDPIHELALRLGALRVLGLDHVRSAHPLFRADEAVAAAASVDYVVSSPALLFSERVALVAPAPVPARPKRRPRHGRMRSTAPLRLVVARAARPQT